VLVLLGEFLADTVPLPRCRASYYAQVVIIMFFLFSSDIFVTLRYTAFILVP